MSTNEVSTNEVSTNNGGSTIEVSPSVILASQAQAVGFRGSYHRLFSVLMTSEEKSWVPVTVDVANVVWQTIRLLPGIMAMRPRAAAALPEHDMTCFDQLEDSTGALYHAHVMSISPAAPDHPDVIALGAEVAEARDAMYGQIEYLVHTKVVDKTRLDPVKKATGYKKSSAELLVLVGIAREFWHLIDGKLLLTAEQLDQYELLAKRMADSVAERDRLAGQSVDAQQMRSRAFTLFEHNYDQTRRALSYLLWDDPDRLEQVCPSLYAGQRGKRGGKAVEKAPADGATPAPADGSTDASKATDAAPAPTGGAVHKLPGGNPFLP